MMISFQFQSTRPLRAATSAKGFPAHSFCPFQSTRPLRAATTHAEIQPSSVADFNPRGPCGPRRFHSGAGCTEEPISIHAALAGRDNGEKRQRRSEKISIHAALAGRDASARWPDPAPRHFNPRGPCGPRPGDMMTHGLDFLISIHAALAGRDGSPPQWPWRTFRFQSTRPLRAATAKMHKSFAHFC